jgi:hypothetical protein
MTYFNTNSEDGDTLASSQTQAATQEDRILELFSDAGGGYQLTPFQVKNLLHTTWPITSIRRAMTVLTNEGKLVKQDRMQIEMYGKYNHTWALPHA